MSVPPQDCRNSDKMSCIGTPPLSASVRGEIEIQLYTFLTRFQEYSQKRPIKSGFFSEIGEKGLKSGTAAKNQELKLQSEI